MLPPSSDDTPGRVSALTERIRTGARKAFGPSAPASRPTEALELQPAARALLPARYQIKEDDGGRYLSCNEASNIAVRVERGLSVSASSARKYPRGTIFLDGAAQAEPFLDAAKGVYNLDHHEGCVRAFTVATCEQAMILVLKGLDLDDERWTVWVNEPDFDAVLAVWLLLNHRRLTSEDHSLRDRMMPIVRLQGVIDAHGFELQGLTAFPPGLQARTLETVNELRAEELALKADDAWEAADFLDYTRSALQRIDDTVYTSTDFEGRSEIEELGRIRISPHRIAIACRSDSGIYEVEEQLREIHDDRLGLVILQKDPTVYTLRQSDPFLPAGLDELYQRLNLLDPAVEAGQRWGGSGDIGGSPRGSGTGLGLDEIMDICRWVFQPPSVGRRLGSVLGAGAAAVAALALAAVAGGGGAVAAPGLLLADGGRGHPWSALTLALLGLAATALGRRRRPGCYGWRRPRSWGFLTLVPITGLAVAAGGGWVPPAWLAGAGAGWSPLGLGLGVVLAGVLGIELLVHGAVHGILVTAFPVMLTTGRRFLSAPNAISAVIYAAAVLVCLAPPAWLLTLANRGTVGLAWVLCALVMGLLCGSVRERWGSVWAPVALHAVSALIVLGVFAALL